MILFVLQQYFTAGKETVWNFGLSKVRHREQLH
jgi:hypothetical protein